jgi:hypothetical protein
MTTLLNFSKSIYTERCPNSGSHAVGSGDYLFSLGPEKAPVFNWSNNIFTLDSTDYVEGIGWTEGDYHQVEQDIDLTDVDSINLVGKAQAPDGLINGSPYSGSTSELYWEFSMGIGASIFIRRRLDKRITDLSDYSILTAYLNGTYLVKFRLELVS